MSEAVPDDEVLRARFGPRIDAELAELDGASDTTTADRRPVTLDQQSVGRLSRMDALQGQAMAKALEARRAGRRTGLKAARHRLEEGDFGWCEDCGEFIGLPRLELDPVVTRCGEP